MIKRKKYMVWLFIFCLCISTIRIPVNTKAATDKISITEFFNNGVFGENYEKARGGAIVTISNVEEMKIFFQCLESPEWTTDVSFQQEADISFSDCTFSYDNESQMFGIYKGNTLLGTADRSGNLFQSYSKDAKNTILHMGLTDAYIEREKKHEFLGSYDGQNYSISGFILTDNSPMHSGIFGFLSFSSYVCNVHIKNCFLLNGNGVLGGGNNGIISNCSTEYMVGFGTNLGGILTNNGYIVKQCKVSHSTLVNLETSSWFPSQLGGISANLIGGEIKDCSTEDVRILAYDNNLPAYAGGIVGYHTLGNIHDCMSYGTYVVPKTGRTGYAGGIVGYLSGIGDLNISNCAAAGVITGRVTGGLVGRCGAEENADSQRAEIIKNCVSYSKLDGNVSGGLVGTLEEGSFLTCYYYDELANSDAVGTNIAGKLEDCHAVNQSQVFGAESAGIIDKNSAYSDTSNLLIALNTWVADNDGFFQFDNNGYFKWKKGVQGYPILCSESDDAPKGDYVLGSGDVIISPGVNIPSPSPSNTPEPPVPTPSLAPSGTPEVSHSPSITPEVSAEPSATPVLTIPSPAPNEDTLTKKQLATKKLQIKLTDSLQVKLTWNKNKNASGYQVLRSRKKSSGYKVIATTSVTKLSYTDKTAKRGNTYYYMVKAFGVQNQKKIYGDGQTKKIQIAWYKAPKIQLSKGKTPNGKLYVQVKISKYSGTYVEVYFKTGNKNYVMAPLGNKKISAYRGKLRFSYSRKSVLHCKVRTYQIKNGKKRYSAFSKEKAIRL